MLDKTQRHTTYKVYVWKYEMNYNAQSIKTYTIYKDCVLICANIYEQSLCGCTRNHI